MLHIMAIISVLLIVVGLCFGIFYPGPITGAIFPIGLMLFSITGYLARRQDKN